MADLFAGPDRVGQPATSSAFAALEAQLAKSKSTAKQNPLGVSEATASALPQTDPKEAAWTGAEHAARPGADGSMAAVSSITPEIIEVEAARQRAQDTAKYGPGRFYDKSKKLSAGRDEEVHGPE